MILSDDHDQVFVLDHRTHSKNELIHENLGVLQGPSLLAYNDATFHEQDWDALRNISRSSKKTDPLCVPLKLFML